MDWSQLVYAVSRINWCYEHGLHTNVGLSTHFFFNPCASLACFVLIRCGLRPQNSSEYKFQHIQHFVCVHVNVCLVWWNPFCITAVECSPVTHLGCLLDNGRTKERRAKWFDTFVNSTKRHIFKRAADMDDDDEEWVVSRESWSYRNELVWDVEEEWKRHFLSYDLKQHQRGQP